MIVAQWADRRPIQMLIEEFGASPNIENEGRTAADIARAHGHLENAQFIESWLKRKIA